MNAASRLCFLSKLLQLHQLHQLHRLLSRPASSALQAIFQRRGTCLEAPPPLPAEVLEAKSARGRRVETVPLKVLAAMGGDAAGKGGSRRFAFKALCPNELIARMLGKGGSRKETNKQLVMYHTMTLSL
eukprot:g13023.t1